MIAPISTSLSFLYILFSANQTARLWGPHNCLAVLFGTKKCVEVNGVKKASKTPSESAFDLFYTRFRLKKN
ncbi:hypothetical protein YC2023_033382 [Brassica napus]